MYKFIFFILFFNLLSFLSSFSQKSIEINDLSHRTQLEAYNILFFDDSTESYSIETIKAVEFDSISYFSDLEESSIYWAKIIFTNNKNYDASIILDFYEVTNIYTYYVNNYGQQIESITGWYVAKNENPLILSSRFYSKIEVYANSSQVVYLKLKNNTDISPRIQIHVWPEDIYLKVTFFEVFFHGIFQGLLLMLVIFGVFYLFVARDMSYLFFVAFMLFFAVYFMQYYRIIYQVFGPIGQISDFLYWLIIPALLFYMNFSRLFLNLKTKLPKLDKIFLISIAIGVLVAVISFISIFFSYVLYMKMLQGFVVFYTVIFTFFIYAGFKIKNKISGYYLKGALFFFIGGFLAMLGALNIIELNSLYLQIGLIGQFFFFTIGLQYKNQKEREQAQLKIIEQLEENKALQTKVNRELETKVQERTKEIKTQNEEILAQSERLQSANHEITAQRDDIQEKSNLLENKNKQITSSIVYASRIQKAILGNINNIISNFSDAFIFFSPHSIVSGDFYWYAKIDDYEVIIAADCTGHGVPGAFMTVMGHDFLDDIISKEKIVMPNDILLALDKKIINRLMKKSATNQVEDGMDMSVITINKNEGKLWFSGAKNPLFYVRDNEMKVIKASKHSIGGENIYIDEIKSFDVFELEYKKDDKFYLLSDGFQDQFGGKKYSKFMVRNLRNLLLENSSKPMRNQELLLEENLKQWQGDLPQTDDILVIGFKI